MQELLEKYKNYLIARNLSLNYFNAIRPFLLYLEKLNKKPEELTQEIITNFFIENSHYGISSRNQVIKAGRSFYRFLGILNNEWSNIKLLKTERRIPNYLSEKEIGKAISHLGTYHSKVISPLKSEALLYFMFYTGCRKGELLNLKRTDFDLTNCKVVFWGEKTKTERRGYYSKEISKLLNEYFNSEKEEINAFNLKLYDINYTFRLLKKIFPNKKISPHIARHSGARYMIEKGIPINIVQKLMGHSSLQTTMIYIDPDEEQIERIYKNKMNKKDNK